MSRYNAILTNDVVNGEGVCVSFFIQGCPHHCKGCFNPETWDFEGGKPYTEGVKKEIIKAIKANGIRRNFSILGGEPLARKNIEMTKDIVKTVRNTYPDIKIFLWTGYDFEDSSHDMDFFEIIQYVDVVIDGKFIEELKDLNLRLRGSSNQRVWIKENGFWRVQND